MLRRLSLALTLTAMPFAGAFASEMERVPPVTDPVVQKECGACHMAFQPAFLPAESWQAMMGDLSNHFGEDAWLPPETAAHIERWMVTHAAPMRRSASASVATGGQPPLRITELRWWRHEHLDEREVSPAMWDKAGSRANCQACHAGAGRGNYDDD